MGKLLSPPSDLSAEWWGKSFSLPFDLHDDAKMVMITLLPIAVMGWGRRVGGQNHYHPLTHCNDDAKIFIITLWPIAMMGKSFSLPFDVNDDDENGYHHSLTYCHDGEKPLSPFDLLHGWWENGYHHSLTHCHDREIVITLWPAAVMGKRLSSLFDLVQCNVLNLLQRSIWLGKYHWVV